MLTRSGSRMPSFWAKSPVIGHAFMHSTRHSRSFRYWTCAANSAFAYDPRMFEVYAGHKPGRQSLAVVLSGALLIATLGLAMFQSHQSRALGDAVGIPGTRLTVRPPRDWRQMPNQPNTFILTADEDAGTDLAELRARRLRFYSGRRGALASPRPVPAATEDLSGYTPITPRAEPVDPIAGMPAVERVWKVARRAVFRRRPVQYEQTVIVRDAVSPTGEYIHVEYEPLSEMPSAGDKLLLDAVCAAIRYDGGAASAALADPLQHAGVEFPLAAGWQAVAYDESVPAVRVVRQGSADATVALFRTSLPDDADPSAAMRLLGRAAWRASPRFMEFRSGSRTDGTRVLRAAYRGTRHVSPLRSAWMVVSPQGQAAVLLAAATGEQVEAVEKAAEDIVESLEMTSGAVAPIDFEALLEIIGRG